MNEKERDKGERWTGRERRSTPPIEQLRAVNEQLTLTALQAQEQAEKLACYYDLVEGLDAIVWEADAGADSHTWHFTFVSRQAQTILGYPVERWLQEPNFWIEMIHPEDREQAINSVRSIAGGKDVRIEYRTIASDSRVVWVAMIVRVREGERGSARFRGLMLDITGHKRSEMTLQQLVRELETSRADLQERNEELEQFHDVMVGREIKMMHAEKEIERLQRELHALTSGQDPQPARVKMRRECDAITDSPIRSQECERGMNG